ncbi:MAG: hypothetical protein V3U75_11720 [Methylococcaceae bacterium]
MSDKIKKGSFDLAVEVKLHCLAMMCVNNIQNTCNLKGVAIDESGKCAGLVLFKPKKKDDNK